MATLPTRQQRQAFDQLVNALCLITEAFHLDGRGKLDQADLTEIAGRLGRISSAFELDQIVAKAVEGRAVQLGLASNTADLLTLVEGDLKPLDMLLLSNQEFKALAEKMEAELGGI